MKQVFIETYGCQMNVYDTELIKTILSKHHYDFVKDVNEADVVMLNTCSVRENANRKVYNRIHEIRNARPNKHIKIGVLGCMATNFRKALLENPKLGIDFIAGPDSYKHLPNLIAEVAETSEKSFHVTLSEFETYSDVLPTRREGVNAWIAIMRGCNNVCTFCVVPFTRGRERSRSPENIIDEVKRLVSEGFTQVTLLGQNVNSYNSDSSDFADLMARVSDVPGIQRIRFTSPHPKDFPRKLLNVISERDNICKQVHLPLQAGNTRVLDMMNRTYSQSEFLDLAAEIRETIPNVALSTDIIVGFPTETAEEFEDTVTVVKEVRFESAFIFKYSERPKTIAQRKFKDDVSEADKKSRIIRLNDIQKHISIEKNRAQIGRVQEVLIEELNTKRSDYEMQTRNDHNTIVIVPRTHHQIGDYIQVKITDATPNVLKGSILS